MADELKIRDFIYLDVERMKSIFSQVEKGLIETTSSEKGEDKELKGKVGTGGILSALGFKAEGSAGVLFQNAETETRTLHDHMYNHIENKLIEGDSITEIDVSMKNAWENDDIQKIITDTSFILVKGRIMIDDYERFEDIAEDFNKITLALDFMTNPYKIPKEKNKRKRAEETRINSLKAKGSILEDKFIESLLVIIKTFYKNKLVLKVIPFSDNVFLRFIGTLNKKFLRDSVESILFKYGSLPVSEWKVFGQLSSIYPKGYQPKLQDEEYNKLIENMDKINKATEDLKNPDEKIRNEAITTLKNIDLNENYIEILQSSTFDIALENIFGALRGVDFLTSPKFPSITFTPIAIYREE
jgi:hypothetical protein